MKLFSLTICILSIGMFHACTQDEACRENSAVNLHAAFYTFGTTNQMTVDSLTVYGLGKDSLLYNVKNSINKINLPLNKTDNTSIFVLQFNHVNDTVFVLHANSEYFVSFPCGMVITHQMDTIIATNHVIRGLKIVNRDINTTDEQHVQILL
jgi:hypothetical protein